LPQGLFLEGRRQMVFNRLASYKISVIYGYSVSQTLVHVLKQCGDNLTRENVMKQAASIKDLELGGLLPGVKVNTSATDFAPLSQLQLMRFKGDTWERFGDIISADVGG
jgi:branched-chain amino acid transport system substrate-binding protein